MGCCGVIPLRRFPMSRHTAKCLRLLNGARCGLCSNDCSRPNYKLVYRTDLSLGEYSRHPNWQSLDHKHSNLASNSSHPNYKVRFHKDWCPY